MQAQQQLTDTQYLASFDLEPQSVLQRLQDYAMQYSGLKERISNQNSLNHPNNDKNTSDDLDLNGLTQKISDYTQHILQWSEQYQSIEHLEQQLKTIQFKHQDLQKQHFQFEALQQQLTQLSHDELKEKKDAFSILFSYILIQEFHYTMCGNGSSFLECGTDP